MMNQHIINKNLSLKFNNHENLLEDLQKDINELKTRIRNN